MYVEAKLALPPSSLAFSTPSPPVLGGALVPFVGRVAAAAALHYHNGTFV